MKDGTDLSFDAETVAGGGGLSGADLFAAGVGGVGRRWRRGWVRTEVMKVLLTAVEGIGRRGLRGGFGAGWDMILQGNSAVFWSVVFVLWLQGLWTRKGHNLTVFLALMQGTRNWAALVQGKGWKQIEYGVRFQDIRA
ncbi:unnamed protein product [Vicia faba]|uniref:Uncharacterized protein n=1 Tax=Vicia faba TaxID=3906 RepID=A0AAV0Z199_VICFA|nr:unnamed protein product [Vicia faba]